MSKTVNGSTTETEGTTTDGTEEEVEEEVVEEKTASTGFKFSGETVTYQAYHPDQWTLPEEILFSEFTVTESDLRSKTAEFTSPYDIDLTKGRVCCWIQCKYSENFGGVVLSKEFNKDTGLYEYTAQDWNRLLNSKVYVILAGDITTYDIIKILLVKMGLSTDGLHEIDYYDDTLQEIPDDDDPSESLTASDDSKVSSASTPAEETNDSGKTRKFGTSKNEYKDIKKNPFKIKPEGLYDKLTALDFIRTLILKAGATIDFYMDENGVPRFDKYKKDDWLKERWIFVDTDVYDVKLKNELRDMVTQVAIKRVDPLNADSTLYTSEKTLGVNLAKYWGVMGEVVDNPVPQTSSGGQTTDAGGDTITATGKPTCGHCSGKSPYVNFTRTYKNECPFCGGELADNPKGVADGEITCTKCDADFCTNCGYEKLSTPRKHLTPVGASFDGGDTGGSSSSGGSTRSGTDASTTDSGEVGEDGSTMNVEDPKKNKQMARIVLSQSVRKFLNFTFKTAGEYPNLHTNSFFMLMTSKKFLMENLPEIGKGMEGKFTRYAGYEKNRYYIEEVVKSYTPQTGLYTEIKANPFASDYSNYAKQQIQAESALASALGGGGGLGNANGQDCPPGSLRTNQMAISQGQKPTSKQLKVIGNSSANYAKFASKYSTPQALLKAVHKRYHWVNYNDNRKGDCPRELFAKGQINCNCAGAAWLMKCMFDCKGWKNYMLKGSPAGTGHYWNCVQYQGRWIMADLCYWGYSHNQLSRM